MTSNRASRFGRRLSRLKGRQTSHGSFSALPHEIFQSAQFARLSPRAVKLLIDMFMQHRGRNNGDLVAAWAVMRTRGWTSKSQLAKALAELEATGWLLRTRQGGINRASLYAVTFLGIEHCNGKLEVKADPKPLNLWRLPGYEHKKERSRRRVKFKSPPLHTGQSGPHGGAVVTLLNR